MAAMDPPGRNGAQRGGVHRAHLGDRSGPVFSATPTDRAVRGAASLIVLVTLIDLAVRTRRQNVRQAVEIR